MTKEFKTALLPFLFDEEETLNFELLSKLPNLGFILETEYVEILECLNEKLIICCGGNLRNPIKLIIGFNKNKQIEILDRTLNYFEEGIDYYDFITDFNDVRDIKKLKARNVKGLKESLSRALNNENYEEAVKIRDLLK